MEILGIDIGGTGIKGAIVDLDNGALMTERHRLPTPDPSTPAEVAKTVGEMVRHFRYSGPIGFGFPAVVIDGVALTATNIHNDWIQTNVETLFERETGCPCKVINDADAAGLAEMAVGAGRKVKGVVIVITVGTGIGSALFTDGRLVPNTELGHVIMKEEIAEYWASDAARKRFDLSWEAWAENFDNYLLYLEKLFNPKLFVIGGGVSSKMDKFEHFLTVETPIVSALMQNEAGIVGAAFAAESLIMQKH